MTKNLIILAVFLGGLFKTGYAQTDTSMAPNVAVFSPLFLDSCFGDKGYKYGKLVPRFAIPGVEYYYGAAMATDSLKKEGHRVNVFHFDSKSARQTVSSLIQSGELNKMNMIIGSVAGNDARLLADFALKKHIPFISGTYPNDAGVTNNPMFVVMNPTLRTHCETIYSYLQKNYAANKVVLFTRAGSSEDRIRKYFSDLEKNSVQGAMAIKTVVLNAQVNPDTLANFVDTSVLTTYIVGSTDLNFGRAIAHGLVNLNQQENAVLVGMPTWDDISDFSKKEFNGLNIYYPVPMTTPSGKAALAAAAKFKAKFGAVAGDYVYRGFEDVYHFTRLLLKYKTDTGSNLTDKSFMLYSTANIQPVMLNASNMTLDYFENKKVYLIKKLDGIVKVVN